MVISYQLAITRCYSTSITTSTNSPSSRIDAAQMACSQNQRATPQRVLPGPTKSPVRRDFWRCGSCDLPTRCSTCQILGDQIAGPPGCCLERPAQLGFFSANGAPGAGAKDKQPDSRYGSRGCTTHPSSTSGCLANQAAAAAAGPPAHQRERSRIT